MAGMLLMQEVPMEAGSHEKRSMKTTKYWIVVNGILLAIYLYFAIKTWPTVAQQDIGVEVRINIADDVLFLIFFPVLFAYLTINCIWLILIIVNTKREKLCFSLLIWFLVSTSWVFVFVYDRNRASLESPRLQEIRKHEPDWGK